MRAFRKFCQRVSNFDNALFFSLVNEGRKNPITNGPPAKRHLNGASLAGQ